MPNQPRKPWDKGGTTRHQQGYGTAWDKLRKFILARDNHLCQICLSKGRTAVGNQVDHRLPKAKGGTDDPANLWVLCRPCHDEKTIRDQGKKPRRRVRYGLDGWPIED